MKTQKHIFFRVTAFVVVLVLILTGLSVVFRPKSTSASIDDEDAGSLDYLVLGDSECCTSFTPMELWNQYGYVGYNCGVFAQRMQNAYYGFETTLESQAPKVVLLEANLAFTNQNNIRIAQNACDHLFGNVISLYRYHNEWQNFLLTQLDDKHAAAKKNAWKGFHTSGQVTPYTGGNYVTATDTVTQIAEPQRTYLDKIVELCRNNGIELILYSVPAPRDWSYAKHNGLAAYASENGLAYVDLNLLQSEVGMDWSKDTYDKGDHVNLAGALKVTTYLGAYLHSNTKLPDHRGDMAYADWDAKYQLYLGNKKKLGL